MKLAVLLAALCVAAPAAAQNVIKVARAEVKLPAGEWVTLPPGMGDGLRVEGFAGVEAEVQTAFLVHGGAVRAWVEVAATPRTFGYPLELANICRTRSATVWSQAVEEGNPLDLQCVAATAAFGATRALEARPTLSAAARERGLSLPSEVIFVSAHMVRRMGLLMRLRRARLRGRHPKPAQRHARACQRPARRLCNAAIGARARLHVFDSLCS